MNTLKSDIMDHIKLHIDKYGRNEHEKSILSQALNGLTTNELLAVDILILRVTDQNTTNACSTAIPQNDMFTISSD